MLLYARKVVKMMKKPKKVLAKIAAITAEHMLTHNANSTSCVVIFQPKLPKNFAEFKSSENDFKISKKIDIKNISRN